MNKCILSDGQKIGAKSLRKKNISKKKTVFHDLRVKYYYPGIILEFVILVNSSFSHVKQ